MPPDVEPMQQGVADRVPLIARLVEAREDGLPNAARDLLRDVHAKLAADLERHFGHLVAFGFFCFNGGLLYHRKGNGGVFD